uniref:Cytochrome-b5 reductase n=1 Tax=Romanomermis culicivorax TaxID=13658 RepID=A0A915INU2_ROMCU
MSRNLLAPPLTCKLLKKPVNSCFPGDDPKAMEASKSESKIQIAGQAEDCSVVKDGTSGLCISSGRFENRKLPLAKGRSLNDWIRLSSSTAGKNLAGTNGRILNVNEDDMKAHNSAADAWTILDGRVFNITPYLEYHPGGAEQLARIAGTDGTDLFNQYHQWVSWEGMLRNCLVGRFVGDRSKLPPPRPEATLEDNIHNLTIIDRQIRLENKIQLTNDSFMFIFVWFDEKDKFDIPPGCHVYLKINGTNGQSLERPYTPVKWSTSFRAKNGQKIMLNDKKLNFVIKIYTNGRFTKILDGMNIGESLVIGTKQMNSKVDGNFIEKCNSLLILAAGTGITPFLSIISYLSSKSKNLRLNLVYFNRNIDSVICANELESLKRSLGLKMRLIYVLGEISQSSSGNAEIYSGLASAALFFDHIRMQDEKFDFVFVCGPQSFNILCCSLLSDRYLCDQIFVFDE